MEKYAIGIDIGGTKIEAVIVNDDGRLIERLTIPTESSLGANKIIKNIIGLIEEISEKYSGNSISTIGIGVAGQVDKNSGFVVYAPNLDWHNINLAEPITLKFGIPVAICNDVRAAAWGEWILGSGIGYNDLVCVFVGTGVGGAIISNGKMLEGYNNTAGEIGHVTVKVHGHLCHCGNYGCLEALAGGWAIHRDAKLAVENDGVGGKLLLELAGGNIDAITAAIVAKAAIKGDFMANKIMDNVVDALVAGTTSIINMLGTSAIILGGGIIEGAPHMIARIDDGIRKNALKAAMPGIKILPSKLKNDAGAIGAAMFALKSCVTTN